MATTNLSNVFEPEAASDLTLFPPHSADKEIEGESGKRTYPKSRSEITELGLEHSSPAAQFVLCLCSYFLLEPTVLARHHCLSSDPVTSEFSWEVLRLNSVIFM